MKTFITILALFQFLTVSSQELRLDPDKSKVEWIGYGEIGDFKQEGSINAKEGSLTLENEMIVSGMVIIDMKTIKHPDKSLSKHLSKKDFFWTKKYPIAELNLISIEENKVFGELTIRGIMQTIKFPIQIEKRGESTIISGAMTIDRTLFNIKYNSSSYFQDLGNYAIKNEFDLNFELVFD